MKKISLLLFNIISLILELLPNGATLKFAIYNYNSEIRYDYRYYSYFDLTPFGYASFGPLLTGIITIIVLLLASINLINNKLNKPIFILSILGFVTSLMPLMYGLDYFTLIGLFISL